MEHPTDPLHLDVMAMARDGVRLEGQGALADFSRLADEQLDGVLTAGPVMWQLQGRLVSPSGGADEIWLDVQASVHLPMQCQRCLTPVVTPVVAERSFRFVADEATALALDDGSEEDLLVISRDFDALALVEDELILSLPLVPLHERCPETVPMSSVDPDFEVAAQRPNPFGVLAGLKSDGSK